MITDDEVRLLFSKLEPVILKWRGAIGPFDYFLAGFRAAHEMSSNLSLVEHERLSLRGESD